MRQRRSQLRVTVNVLTVHASDPEFPAALLPDYWSSVQIASRKLV